MIKLKWLGQYILHLFFAAVLFPAATFVVGMLFVILFRSNTRVIDYVLFGPTFAFPIALGLMGGAKLGGLLSPTIGRILWVLPFLLLVWEGAIMYRYNPAPFWQTMYDQFFGINCGSSECMTQVLITTPFLSAIAYSVGAELSSRLRRKRRRLLGRYDVGVN